ncbi:MAG: hypothetical protein ACTTKR_01100 [Dialister pneumosintes]
MNDPIISPYVFYLIDVLNSINKILIVAIIVGVSIGLVVVVNWIVGDFEYKKLFFLTKKWMVGMAVILLLVIVIPSKDVCYQMLVASQVTPANIQKAGDTIDKSLDKISDFIVNTANKIDKKDEN